LPSARSPSSTTVQLAPESDLTPKNPPPTRHIASKSYIPPKLKKGNRIYLDSLDTFIKESGKPSRSVVVSLALQEKVVRQKRKNLIKAFDKYLLDKFGHKIASDENANTEIVLDVHAKEMSLPKPPAEPGKRPVFRRMKTLVPFDERGRPITQGRDKPVVNEDFPAPNKTYKPSTRPPSYRLDLRQYPPNKNDPIFKDITFDKRQGSIINHATDRGMTFGEISFPEHKSIDSERSSNVSSLSQLQRLRYNVRKKSNAKGYSRKTGFGADHTGSKALVGNDFDASARESDLEGSRNQTDTPVDSITASMMKEIYDSLNDYLEEEKEDQGTQYEPVHKEIFIET
jgi:hypothetical protein